MKRGVILITIIGILLVITFLALITISMMLQQARIAEHKVQRMKAVFAAKAGMIHILEELRKGNIALPTVGNPGNVTLANVNNYIVNLDIIAKGDVGCPNSAPSEYCIQATAQ